MYKYYISPGLSKKQESETDRKGYWKIYICMFKNRKNNNLKVGEHDIKTKLKEIKNKKGKTKSTGIEK